MTAGRIRRSAPHLLFAASLLFTGCRGPASLPSSSLTSDGTGIDARRPAETRIVLVGKGWNDPTGVGVDPSGNVFVVEPTSDQLRKVAPPFTGPDRGKISIEAPRYSQPRAIAVDARGNVYVADAKRITQLNADGVLSQVAKVGGATGIAVNAAGDVFIAGLGNDIYRARYEAGDGWNAPQPMHILGLSGPKGVAVDKAGDLFVADTGNNAVKKCKLNGMVVDTYSHFKLPQALAVPPDCSGDCGVYVANTGADHVVHLYGASIQPVGFGYSSPEGVAAGDGGRIYVADTGNGQVKEVLQH